MNTWLLGTLLLNCLLFSLLIQLHSGAERSNTVRAPGNSPQGWGGASSPGSVQRLGKGVRGGFAGKVRLRWAKGRATHPREDHNSLHRSPDSNRKPWDPEGRRHARQPDYLPGDGRGNELKDAALIVFCFNRQMPWLCFLLLAKGWPCFINIAIYCSNRQVPVIWVRCLTSPHAEAGLHT